MSTPFHSMQHHRDRGLIKGLQVCCLEVVLTEIKNSLSQTQKLNTYRNKIAREALVSCNCSMLPSNQTCTREFFFPVYTLQFFIQQTAGTFSFVLMPPIHPVSFPFPLLWSCRGRCFSHPYCLDTSSEGTERANGFFLLNSEVNSTEAQKTKSIS